jgi:hypothetical protein
MRRSPAQVVERNRCLQNMKATADFLGIDAELSMESA